MILDERRLSLAENGYGAPPAAPPPPLTLSKPLGKLAESLLLGEQMSNERAPPSARWISVLNRRRLAGPGAMQRLRFPVPAPPVRRWKATRHSDEGQPLIETSGATSPGRPRRSPRPDDPRRSSYIFVYKLKTRWSRWRCGTPSRPSPTASSAAMPSASIPRREKRRLQLAVIARSWWKSKNELDDQEQVLDEQHIHIHHHHARSAGGHAVHAGLGRCSPRSGPHIRSGHAGDIAAADSVSQRPGGPARVAHRRATPRARNQARSRYPAPFVAMLHTSMRLSLQT